MNGPQEATLTRCESTGNEACAGDCTCAQGIKSWALARPMQLPQRIPSLLLALCRGAGRREQDSKSQRALRYPDRRMLFTILGGASTPTRVQREHRACRGLTGNTGRIHSPPECRHPPPNNLTYQRESWPSPVQSAKRSRILCCAPKKCRAKAHTCSRTWRACTGLWRRRNNLLLGPHQRFGMRLVLERQGGWRGNQQHKRDPTFGRCPHLRARRCAHSAPDGRGLLGGSVLQHMLDALVQAHVEVPPEALQLLWCNLLGELLEEFDIDAVLLDCNLAVRAVVHDCVSHCHQQEDTTGKHTPPECCEKALLSLTATLQHPRPSVFRIRPSSSASTGFNGGRSFNCRPRYTRRWPQ